MMTPDSELLQHFVREKSQAAFTELVRRHLDLVYATALRQARSPQLAEEISQCVFTDLAGAAHKLKPDTVLAAWLYRVTRRTAIDIVRRESRRQARERLAAEMAAMNTPTDWTQIEPLLDEAMEALDETDRAAILLRYFENKSLREVGQSLGTSDDAAQKRVSRAVERLREFFSKGGIAMGASGLIVLISANAVQSAPAALAAAISAAVFAGTIAPTSAGIAATKLIAMTTLQKTLIAAAIAVVAGTGLYQAHHAAQLRQQNQILLRQQTQLAAQVRQLQRERDEATSQLASMTDDSEESKSNNLELLRLRHEIAVLTQNQGIAPASQNPDPAATETTDHPARSPEDIGRDLGLAVIHGEAGAFDRLLAESQAEHQDFNTNSVGLDDTRRGELATRTFAPLRTAFKVIEEAAMGGNASALDALSRSLQFPELNALAAGPLGELAAKGDPNALEVLVHPEKYGALLSSTIPALKPVADSGNPAAIQALAAVASDPKSEPLWYMTAGSLSKAASSGNPVAIDALIKMSSSTNRTIQKAVAEALRGAAANQNAEAAQALRSMGQ